MSRGGSQDHFYRRLDEATAMGAGVRKILGTRLEPLVCGCMGECEGHQDASPAALPEAKPSPLPNTPQDEHEPAISLIQHERRRQIEVEKWSHESDDLLHKRGDLADAAACYAKVAAMISYPGPVPLELPSGWPWAREWWKPSSDPIRNLVKSAALIVAEIERLQRSKLLAAPKVVDSKEEPVGKMITFTDGSTAFDGRVWTEGKGWQYVQRSQSSPCEHGMHPEDCGECHSYQDPADANVEDRDLPPRPEPQGGDYRPHYRKRETDAFIAALDQEKHTLESQNKALKHTVADMCGKIAKLSYEAQPKVEEQDGEQEQDESEVVHRAEEDVRTQPDVPMPEDAPVGSEAISGYEGWRQELPPTLRTPLLRTSVQGWKGKDAVRGAGRKSSFTHEGCRCIVCLAKLH